MGFTATEELIKQKLGKMRHPVFKDARIKIETTWYLHCTHCNAKHRFSIGTKELDPCCSQPTFRKFK